MTIIAIDPGVSGGLAYFSPAYLEFEAHIGARPMPTAVADIIPIIRTLAQYDGAEVWLEDIPKFTGRNIPSSTTAVLFRNFGFIEGAVTAMGLRVVMVRPQAWQKHFSLGTKNDCASTTEWKNKLKAEAIRRFPKVDVTLKTSDALLILDYAMHMRKEPAQHGPAPVPHDTH